MAYANSRVKPLPANGNRKRNAKAYNMGRAYGAAKAGRRISGLNSYDRAAFKRGYKVGYKKNKGGNK